MKRILLISAMFLILWNLNAQMVLEFNTVLSEGTTITLPLNGTVNVSIDWGDGSTETFTSNGNIDHTYSVDGTFTVSITGTLTQFGNTNLGYSHGDKLVKVSSFGDLGLKSLDGAFFEATNLTEIPDQIPSSITNLSWMLVGATKFNQNLSSWNLSNVTNISCMFYWATTFNQDIGNWNVSNVKDMGGLFQGAISFNQNIGDWDVSNVTDMVGLFTAAETFNQDLSKWDVSNVTRMAGMFKQAYVFNQDIGNWDVSNVTDMNQMFDYAPSFNQDIGAWDVSKVTDMSFMFSGRYDQPNSFNQDISDWDVSNVINMQEMFKGVQLSTAYYNNILINWPTKGLSQDVAFNAGESKYSSGISAEARQNIIDNYNWTITDGGESNKPAIITLPISDFSSINPSSGGSISEDGGSPVTKRGVVWNTTLNPTISTKLGITDEGTGKGIFNSDISGIAPGTKYYVRAYATNANGTGYGNNLDFVIIPELTVTGSLVANDKDYDGSIEASQVSSTLNLASIVSGYDNVTLSDVVLTFDNKNVGTNKTVSISSAQLTGSDASKYKLSLTSSPTSIANITAKPLTISDVTVADKVYDGTTDVILTGASLNGIVSGDTIEIDSKTGAFNDKNVGTDKIITTEITIKGLDASNYIVTQPTGLKAGITAKDIYIGGSFTVSDKVYDGTMDAIIAENNLEISEAVVEGDDVELISVIVNFEQSEIGNDIPVSILSADLKGSDKFNYNLLLDNSPTTTASITTNVNVDESKVLRCNLYPNPFCEYVYITGVDEKIIVTLTNLTGQKLFVKSINEEKMINTNNIQSGIYFLIIESKNSKKQVIKLVKQ